MRQKYLKIYYLNIGIPFYTLIRHEPEKRFGKEININQKFKEFYDEIKNIN